MRRKTRKKKSCSCLQGFVPQIWPVPHRSERSHRGRPAQDNSIAIHHLTTEDIRLIQALTNAENANQTLKQVLREIVINWEPLVGLANTKGVLHGRFIQKARNAACYIKPQPACQHPRIDFILTKESIRKIKGGRVEWCPDCGSIRHTDIDGVIRWARPRGVSI